NACCCGETKAVDFTVQIHRAVVVVHPFVVPPYFRAMHGVAVPAPMLPHVAAPMMPGCPIFGPHMMVPPPAPMVGHCCPMFPPAAMGPCYPMCPPAPPMVGHCCPCPMGPPADCPAAGVYRPTTRPACPVPPPACCPQGA